MKVEELERFGAALKMPKEAVKEQNKIILRAGTCGEVSIFSFSWENKQKA